MWASQPWRIPGYRGQLVANSPYLHGDSGSQALAALLPGLRYSCEGPLLLYLGKLLFEVGHDVLAVNYAYDKNEPYGRAEDSEKGRWLQADAEAVVRSAGSLGYQRFVLVGKSLGTLAMLHLLQKALLPGRCSLVWLTPALTSEDMLRLARTLDFRSLFLVGSSDPFYREGDYAALRGNPQVTLELFQGADHSLEAGDDVTAAIANLSRCVAAVRLFLQGALA